MYQTEQIRDGEALHAPAGQAPGGTAPPHHCHHCEGASAPRPRSRRRSAWLWGISGTVLSAVGWIALMLFDQYNASLGELRTDLKHFHEARAELVTKERLRKMIEHVKDAMKELQAAAIAREALQRELQASEKTRKGLARELQRVRERLASVEGRQAATAALLPPPIPTVAPAD